MGCAKRLARPLMPTTASTFGRATSMSSTAQSLTQPPAAPSAIGELSITVIEARTTGRNNAT